MTHIKEYIYSSLKDIYPPGELKSFVFIICRDMLELAVMDIYSCKDINLSVKKERILQEAVGRLKKHEPIQYVRGYAEFREHKFRVQPGVLIPRPETEELVDLILKENTGSINILDVGTGSGCIAVTLSYKLPEATVDAWDFSEEALDIARQNNEDTGTKVSFYKVDALGKPDKEKHYDVIVSNPPYVMDSEKTAMDKNVLDWEPASALFVPDADPLVFYRHIAEFGLTNLYPAGKIYFEINRMFGGEIAEMLEAMGYRNARIIKDLSGNNRIVTAGR